MGPLVLRAKYQFGFLSAKLCFRIGCELLMTRNLLALVADWVSDLRAVNSRHEFLIERPFVPELSDDFFFLMAASLLSNVE